VAERGRELCSGIVEVVKQGSDDPGGDWPLLGDEDLAFCESHDFAELELAEVICHRVVFSVYVDRQPGATARRMLSISRICGVELLPFATALQAADESPMKTPH
jgi:hypothetical protein